METMPITTKDVEQRLITLRGQRVLLDRDVADLYGVETRIVNQAVRNNPDKFPPRCLIQLDDKESAALRSKFLILDENGGRGSRTCPHNGGLAERSRRRSSAAKPPPEDRPDSRRHSRTKPTPSRMAISLLDCLRREGGKAPKGVNLSTESTETEIELNFAVVKIKHKVTRK